MDELNAAGNIASLIEMSKLLSKSPKLAELAQNLAAVAAAQQQQQQQITAAAATNPLANLFLNRHLAGSSSSSFSPSQILSTQSILNRFTPNLLPPHSSTSLLAPPPPPPASTSRLPSHHLNNFSQQNAFNLLNNIRFPATGPLAPPPPPPPQPSSSPQLNISTPPPPPPPSQPNKIYHCTNCQKLFLKFKQFKRHECELKNVIKKNLF